MPTPNPTGPNPSRAIKRAAALVGEIYGSKETGWTFNVLDEATGQTWTRPYAEYSVTRATRRGVLIGMALQCLGWDAVDAHCAGDWSHNQGLRWTDVVRREWASV